MKKLLVYYFIILAPVILLIYASNMKQISSGWFAILLFAYAFIYRNITDYYRLRSKNVITKKEFWKLLRIGSRMTYFKELYLI